jgi:hypothetical protein
LDLAEVVRQDFQRDRLLSEAQLSRKDVLVMKLRDAQAGERKALERKKVEGAAVVHLLHATSQRVEVQMGLPQVDPGGTKVIRAWIADINDLILAKESRGLTAQVKGIIVAVAGDCYLKECKFPDVNQASEAVTGR